MLPTIHAGPLDTEAVLKGWFAAQKDLRTWSASFTQTRRLKALTQPLQTSGRIWVALPDRFRWELGEPAQTLAVRRTNELVIAYPRLQRAERYALGDASPGPWKDALALLDAGFPRSRADLDVRFRVTGLTTTNAAYALKLEPRSAATRRFLPTIELTLATNGFHLLATQVTFADGSTLRNDYRDAQINPPVEDARFEPPIEPGYQGSRP